MERGTRSVDRPRGSRIIAVKFSVQRSGFPSVLCVIHTEEDSY